VAPNLPDLSQVNYNVWGVLQEKVYKIRIADLDELKQRLGTKWVKLDHASLQQSFISNVTDSSRSAMRALYTFSCDISHIFLSTGFKSGEFGRHS